MPPVPPAARTLALVLALATGAAALAGCSDSADVDASGDETTVSTVADDTTTTAPAGGGTAGNSDGNANGGSDGDATTTTAGDDDDLPGQPFDIGPPAGATLDVVGVANDDVLNFRTGPDPSAPVVDTVAPLSPTPAIVSSGEGRLLDRGAWWKVTVGGQEAWANVAFLGMLGLTDDIGAEVLADLGGADFATVEEAVDTVAAVRAPGPEPEPSIVLASPVQGLDADGAEVIVDVVGLPDDALKGERLLLTFDLEFDDPDASDREVVAYRLIGVQRTLICGRGVTDGACN